MYPNVVPIQTVIQMNPTAIFRPRHTYSVIFTLLHSLVRDRETKIMNHFFRCLELCKRPSLTTR